MEVWKDIIIKGGKSNYEVSSLGRVRRGEKILTPFLDSSRGVNISTSLYYNKKTVRRLVKRLVADAFLDYDSEKCTIKLLDDNNWNCAVDNIELVSKKDKTTIKVVHTKKEKAAKKKKLAKENVYLVGDMINKFDNQLENTVADFNAIFTQSKLSSIYKPNATVEIGAIIRDTIRKVYVDGKAIEHELSCKRSVTAQKSEDVKVLGRKRIYKVYQNDEFKGEFNSQTKVAEAFGIKQSRVSYYANGIFDAPNGLRIEMEAKRS